MGHHRKGGFCGKDDDTGGQLSCHPVSGYSRIEEKRDVNTVQSHVEGTAVNPFWKAWLRNFGKCEGGLDVNEGLK